MIQNYLLASEFKHTGRAPYHAILLCAIKRPVLNTYEEDIQRCTFAGGTYVMARGSHDGLQPFPRQLRDILSTND